MTPEPAAKPTVAKFSVHCVADSPMSLVRSHTHDAPGVSSGQFFFNSTLRAIVTPNDAPARIPVVTSNPVPLYRGPGRAGTSAGGAAAFVGTGAGAGAGSAPASDSH